MRLQHLTDGELSQLEYDIEAEREWRFNPPVHGPEFPLIGPVDVSPGTFNRLLARNLLWAKDDLLRKVAGVHDVSRGNPNLDVTQD